MIRFSGYLLLCASLVVLAACVTKTPKPGEPAAAANPSPTPSAAAPKKPSPSPTPEATYSATAKIIGADGREVASVTPSPTPIPSPTPTASPSPSPASNSTPAPSAGGGNFLTRIWAKIFPPKSKAAAVKPDSPGGSSPATPASPSPTPGTSANHSKEGLLARGWHLVFPRKKVPPTAAPPAWIGSIRLVNGHENYVLVDAPNYPSLPAGETLHAVGDGSENAVLRISPDRNPPFFIADIVNGRPQVGDRVYSPEPAR